MADTKPNGNLDTALDTPEMRRRGDTRRDQSLALSFVLPSGKKSEQKRSLAG
jgi:hypothetical protein